MYAEPRRASPATCPLLFLWLMAASLVGFAACEVVASTTAAEDEYTLAVVNVSYADPATQRPRSIREAMGKFGQGRVAEASGVLVHWRHRNGSANLGCERTPFDRHLLPTAPAEPWIALVRRGGCSYARKIAAAAQLNATAVVVYDDREGSTVKMPNPGGAGYKMVAIFIPQENGERMADMVDNGTRVYMYITVGTHQAVRYTNISRTSVLFVSISFIVLMIISLAWLIFYYVQRFRYINAKDQLARRLCSAAKKALSKIPLKTIKDTDAEAECCAVCIEPYKMSDVVRILPCKHQFHKSCIDPWLLDQRTCPMCKMDILKFYGLVFAGSEESILQIDVVDDGVLRVNLEPLESDAVLPRNPQQTSQAVCGSASGTEPPAGTNYVCDGSMHDRLGSKAHHLQSNQGGLGSKAGSATTSESESSHTFQPNRIDCIKITMLENSPMATRLLNRSKMQLGHSDPRSPEADAGHGDPGSSSRSELPEIAAREHNEPKEECCNKSGPSLESIEESKDKVFEDKPGEGNTEVEIRSSERAPSSPQNISDDNNKPADDNTGDGGAST